MQHSKSILFEQVIADNKVKIYRICRVYALAPVEPEDLFQEVVSSIWKAFSTFEGKASVNTWVYRITLNICMRYKQKLEKSNAKSVRLEAIYFEPKATAPDTAMEEKQRALYQCIQLLNEVDQTIVILFLDELPYKEIAAITGLTENHIAVRMKRMKKTLLNCITSKLKINE